MHFANNVANLKHFLVSTYFDQLFFSVPTVRTPLFFCAVRNPLLIRKRAESLFGISQHKYKENDPSLIYPNELKKKTSSGKENKQN